jgi:DNA helicase-4
MAVELKIGDRVEHLEFGQGRIVQLYPNAQGVVAFVLFANDTVFVDSWSLNCNRIEGFRKKNEIETRKRDETEKKKKDKYIQEIAKRRKEEKRKQEEKELERKKAGELNETRKQALLTRLHKYFESDFLSADQMFKSDPDSPLINESGYQEQKITFIRNWAAGTLGIDLDIEQAAAVAAINGDIKVTARAGSGKTRTLVTRSIFLQKHCRVSPHEILLLAFNTAAANKVKEDLSKVLKGNIPYVLNFHKLAYALVRPKEELIYDDDNLSQFSLSREIQEIIDSHRMKHEYGSQIKDIMLEHFRHDWDRITDGGYHLAIDEFLDHRRKLPRETLKGDYVKSFGEKLIANILFENDVDYFYERYFPGNDFDFRPDFTIPHKDKNGG